MANSYLTEKPVSGAEPRYPLHVRVCDRCFLVQLEDAAAPEVLFSDYAYFSSYSDSWLEHSRRFTDAMTERFDLGPSSQVIEVASNDGYLLRNFVRAGIPALGIEPAANVAAVARQAGVPTEVCFFGAETAETLRDRGIQADLLVANNVLAHVPDLHDFVEGLATVLRTEGALTIEFPHVLQLMAHVQFDTIYHEHFSYFSLLSLVPALARHGLRVFEVQELPTHGGSLRVFACHDAAQHATDPSVGCLRQKEADAGLTDPATYERFTTRVEEARRALRGFLDDAKAEGKVVVGYGAAAKGNTLLNSVAANHDDIAYVVDRSPHKQGRFLPGSHLPVYEPDAVRRTRPDIVLVLVWNLLDEVMQQMKYVREWGCRFAVPIPSARTLP